MLTRAVEATPAVEHATRKHGQVVRVRRGGSEGAGEGEEGVLNEFSLRTRPTSCPVEEPEPNRLTLPSPGVLERLVDCPRDPGVLGWLPLGESELEELSAFVLQS